MHRARTPEMRARIRLRVWAGKVTGFVLLACFLGLIPGSIALPIVFDANMEDYFMWVLAGWVLTVTSCLILSNIIDTSIDKTVFADAHVSTGRIDRVITEIPYDGEAAGTYKLWIVATAANGVTLRRTLTWDMYSNGPAVRTPIRFRHVTIDPDDVHDILEERMPESVLEIPTPTDNSDDWIGRAPTWRARIRLRWWALIERNSSRGLFIAVFGMLAMVPGTFVLAVVIDGLLLGIVLSVTWILLIGMLLLSDWMSTVATNRYHAAKLAIRHNNIDDSGG